MPLQATSGAASYDAFGGGVAAVPQYIEDVFSTYLYTGNSSSQTITNGIDLAGKGGLVWIKSRQNAYSNYVADTARGANRALRTDMTSAERTDWTDELTAFNSTGFTLGASSNGFTNNNSIGTYASWTFRKQPKFFDVVTYTGDGVAGRQISHSLGSAPGAIIVKNTNVARDWAVWHRSLADGTYLKLNTTDAAITNTSFQVFGDASGQTSTYFTVGKTGSGVNGLTNANASGETYVAYLFAHDAGGFGLTSTDNVISCGSYTGNGSTTGPVVTLGYEPQWLMVKRTDDVDDWNIADNMRGLFVGDTSTTANSPRLRPNLSNAEQASGWVIPTATGFQLQGPNAASGSYNASGGKYIYIAIRRGPMKVPTSGTSVFIPVTQTSTGSAQSVTTNFPVDFTISRVRGATSANYVIDRLRGSTSASARILILNTTDPEYSGGPGFSLDSNTKITDNGLFGAGSSVIYECFSRAPSFFDEVCYTGTGSARTINHNLGAVPELMIMKNRSTTGAWYTYVASLGVNEALQLNQNFAQLGFGYWNSTAPTSSVFSIGTGSNNDNGVTYIAYLFATCAGVSKVGSYTGTGTTKQVDCGFTGGARFVLIKRTDSTGDWYVWDSARGIVAGNDPYLLLNSTAAEVTSTDYIDTYSAGFEISSTAPAAINASGGTFIFLAIA